MKVKNKMKEAKELAGDLAKHAAASAKEVAESQAAKDLGAAAKDTAVDALKSDAVKQVAGAAAAGALSGVCRACRRHGRWCGHRSNCWCLQGIYEVSACR